MQASTKAALIIGGSGFLGTHLAMRLRDSYKVFATYHSHPMRIPGVTFLPLQIGNRTWLKRMIYLIRPNVVIFAAGSNGIEPAEKNPRGTEDVQTSGAGNCAQFADIFQPKFIYLSNCFVFDGSRGNYREGDTVLPGTSLGKAKLGGENLVRTRSLNYVLLRSSPVLGRGNGLNFSFLDRLRMKLDRGERIELSEHELHSFTIAESVVDVVERLAESGIRNKIIHFGGLTKVSTFEMGRLFAQRFGYDPKLVVPKPPEGRQSLHGRATVDYSMNSSFAAETLKIQPLLLEQSFDLIEKNLVPAL